MILDIDNAIPAYILTDAMRLKQVFVNLLSNALKFTEEGKIVLYVRVLDDLGEGKNELGLEFVIQELGLIRKSSLKFLKHFRRKMAV